MDYQALIRQRKFARNVVDWQQKDQNKNFMIARMPLYSSEGFTISGIELGFEKKLFSQFEPCKYSFTLFNRLESGRYERFFQLEVMAKDKIAHQESGLIIYGPHLLEIDKTYQIDEDFECEQDEKWLEWFLDRANIEYDMSLYNRPSSQMDWVL